MENNTGCDQAWNFTPCWIESVDGGGLSEVDRDVLSISATHDWERIKEELEWAFPLHIYGFAILFFMLAFYTFFSILNLRSQISTRPFMSTINVFLCILGVSRAICFLVEPYTSGKVMPDFLGSFMWDVGYPCILSAFSLIQLAFSQLTQVKFHPEWLRRKSALSVLITTHFALVFGSDMATAFDTHLQGVRWMVQSVFLSWGLVLCLTFLYGSANVINLLRNIPQHAFQKDQIGQSNNKGILQLALLAQCNNIASSVLSTAAVAPSSSSSSLLTPKIRITDEFDQTHSYVYEGSRVAALHAGETGKKPFEVATLEITEEKEEESASPSSPPETRIMTTMTHQDQREQHSPTPSSSFPKKTGVKNSPMEGRIEYVEIENCEIERERRGSFEKYRIKKVDEAKMSNIIIKVEEVDSGSCNGNDDEERRNVANATTVVTKSETRVEVRAGKSDEVTVSEVRRKGTKLKEVNKFKKADSLKIKKGLYNIHSVKSLDSLLFLDTADNKVLSGDGTVRRGSYTEGVTNNKKNVDSVSKGHSPKASLKVGHDGAIIPKRKKSLTWSEDTQAALPCSKDREPSSPRKGSVVIVEDSEKYVRDVHRKSSVSSRRNSRSYGSEKGKSRNSRTNEFANLIPGPGEGAGGRRRSSTVSSCSYRKGSEQWPAMMTVPYNRKDQRSLSVCSTSSAMGASSRRNSRRSIRDEGEVEALLDRSAGGQTDVTLASILNHIAYFNQAASPKQQTPIKDSRKAQVQQVLVVTYITAVLGTLLSLALVYRIYGYFNSKVEGSPTAAANAVATLPNPPWLWFTYESGCRILEFLMGCAMANITRQPLNNNNLSRRRTLTQYPHSLQLKPRNSIYNI